MGKDTTVAMIGTSDMGGALMRELEGSRAEWVRARMAETPRTREASGG
jgi:hypothetical protein